LLQELHRWSRASLLRYVHLDGQFACDGHACHSRLFKVEFGQVEGHKLVCSVHFRLQNTKFADNDQWKPEGGNAQTVNGLCRRNNAAG